MKLNQFLAAANYQICGGSTHLWKCYPNGQYLDIADKTGNEVGDCVFNPATQDVYEVTVFNDETAFLWIEPAYRTAYKSENEAHKLESSAWDDIKFTKIESEPVILSLVKEFTTNVVESNVSDVEIKQPTLNEYVDNYVENYVNAIAEANDKVTDAEVEMAEYDVSIDVRYVCTVTAATMDDASASAKQFASNMKPSAPHQKHVCWIDHYQVKESVSRSLCNETLI